MEKDARREEERRPQGYVRKMSFTQSTHLQRWLFSPEQLLQKKTQCNEKAFAHLRRTESSPAPMDEKQRKARAEAGTGLTVAEEDLLKRHYELKIQEICEKLQFPEKVMATAILFFKRFYLSKPLTKCNPRDIMYVNHHPFCCCSQEHKVGVHICRRQS